MNKPLSAHEIRQYKKNLQANLNKPAENPLHQQINQLQSTVEDVSSQLQTINKNLQTLLKQETKTKKEEK